ncbi:hypothetical protein BV898_17222 [Hypsibius exemplaris]|uniref:WAP domain-containing protein n=1 Tax=Hypsibius exemplaris TaxID=2072580 RepID=A0A9X6NN98_HYPEX|nr:hypothetical protein BV898_17222 [Hypsibius exemplaris]
MICQSGRRSSRTLVPSRPGTCPLGGTPSNGDRQCYSDNDCASDRKCLPNWNVRFVVLRAAPSDLQPSLPTPGNNKAGTCPVALPTNTAGTRNLPISMDSTSAACWNQCSSDSGCSGDLKCCRTSACSTGCRAPVSNPLPTGVKAGTCNVQQSYEGGCTSSCSADSHCSGTMKAEPALTNGVYDRAEPALTNGVYDKAEPVLTNGIDDKEEPTLTNSVHDRAEPTLTNSVHDRAEPALTNGIDDKAEPTLTNSVHDRVEPALTNGVCDRAEPALTNGIRDRAEPALTNGVCDRAEPALTNGIHQWHS